MDRCAESGSFDKQMGERAVLIVMTVLGIVVPIGVIIWLLII